MNRKPHHKSTVSVFERVISVVLRALFVVFVASTVFVLVGPGCGRLPEQSGAFIDDEDIDEFSDQAVIHPNEGEIAAGDAQSASYLVTFRTNETSSGLHFSSFHNEFAHHYSALSESYLSDPRVEDIRFITSVDLSLRNDPQWKAEFSMPKALGLVVGQSQEEPIVGAVSSVRFSDPASAREVLNEWERDGRLWFAEPNRNSKLFQATDLYGKLAEQYTQNSGGFQHIAAVKSVEAMKFLSGRDQKIYPTDQQIRDEPPVIAVLDSGVDYENPGLKANMWINDQPGASGCKDDIHGCNTVAATKGVLGNGEVWPIGESGPGVACTTPRCDHGTHVSGLIAGDPNAGFAGTCPVCQIMAVRVVDLVNGEARVSDEAQIAGMKYIMYFTRGGSNVVRVVNSSFGKYSRSRTVALIISILRRTGKGTLVVAAAGNEDSMSRTYPAALSDAIAVSALDEYGSKASFSNFGPWVDVAAPGSNLNSTSPGRTTPEPKSGTSMSSPVVAGVAGMVVAANPDISYSGLRNAIVNSADFTIYNSDRPGATEQGQSQPGFNYRNYYTRIPGESAPRPLLGSGIVNSENAVQLKNNTAFISPPLDRVTPNCAVVFGRNLDSNSWHGLGALLLLLWPVAWAMLTRRSHGRWGSI